MVTISLCMIAKDEEAFLDELLTQAAPHVDEIIVALDTRTTDNTREILQQHKATIIDFQWIDDFSAARNASLNAARSDWILVLDADERLSKKDYASIKKLAAQESADAFLLLQRNYTSNNAIFGWRPNEDDPFAKGTGHTDNPLIRLFRNDRRIRFANPVHEIVDASVKKIGGTIQKTTIPIHHYGNLKKEADIKHKQEMYLSISQKQITQDPSNPRPYYEAGKVLKTMGRLDDAAAHFEKAVALNPGYQLVLTNLADTYQKMGKMDLAISTYLRAIKLRPNNENAYINLSLLFMNQGKTKEAITLLDKALSINPKSAAAYNNLSLLLLKVKRPLQAMTVLRRAVDNTGLDKFQKAIDKLQPKIEKLVGSRLESLKKEHAKTPHDLTLATKLGHLYFAAQHYNDAIDLFCSTLANLSDEDLSDETKTPLIFNMYSNLSLAHHRKGDTKQAIKTLQDALALNPPHKEFFEKRIKALKNK